MTTRSHDWHSVSFKEIDEHPIKNLDLLRLGSYIEFGLTHTKLKQKGVGVIVRGRAEIAKEFGWSVEKLDDKLNALLNLKFFNKTCHFFNKVKKLYFSYAPEYVQATGRSLFPKINQKKLNQMRSCLGSDAEAFVLSKACFLRERFNQKKTTWKKVRQRDLLLGNYSRSTISNVVNKLVSYGLIKKFKKSILPLYDSIQDRLLRQKVTTPLVAIVTAVQSNPTEVEVKDTFEVKRRNIEQLIISFAATERSTDELKTLEREIAAIISLDDNPENPKALLGTLASKYITQHIRT